ncbi:MAG TPA: nuclear transport factor 2 family protein [Dongiaceae bacterium]|nr:nuclear transport factor 2 family protein [Dongiaceae bacterium]
MRSPILFLTAACALSASALGQGALTSVPALSADQADIRAVQQIEDEWLQAERSTDLATLERIVADDFAGVGTNGPSPDKAQLLKNLRAHAGQPPPYTVERSDMHIIVRGDTAIAAYTKTYTAKENGNVDHEDMTDVFTRDQGKWKLRISRYTSCHR